MPKFVVYLSGTLSPYALGLSCICFFRYFFISHFILSTIDGNSMQLYFKIYLNTFFFESTFAHKI